MALSRDKQRRALMGYLAENARGPYGTMYEIGVELSHYPTWELDLLGNELAGDDGTYRSTTRKKAWDRLRPLIEHALGRKFPNHPDKGDHNMANVKKAATKKAVVKKAAPKKKAVVKKAAPKKAAPKKKAPAKKAVDITRAVLTGSRFKPKAVITVKEKKNPKRPGTRAHDLFALYRKGMTVEAYVKAGGTTGALRYDEDHGYIKVG